MSIEGSQLTIPSIRLKHGSDNLTDFQASSLNISDDNIEYSYNLMHTPAIKTTTLARHWP